MPRHKNSETRPPYQVSGPLAAEREPEAGGEYAPALEPEDARLEARLQHEYDRWSDVLRHRVLQLKDHVLTRIDPEDQEQEAGPVLIERLRLVINLVEERFGRATPREVQLARLYDELTEYELAISANLKEAIEALQLSKESERVDRREVYSRLVNSDPAYQELLQARQRVLDKIAGLVKEPEGKISLPVDPAPVKEIGEGPKPPYQIELTEDFLNVINAACYFATREALEKNTFQPSEDTPWPTALLNRGGIVGNAQLVPPIVENQPLMPPEEYERWVQVMWQQREELSDLDADALDLLCHTWLQQARKPEDSAVADVDEFLGMRGLKPKQGGQGRRGGYEPEQRTEMLKALSHIQSLWLNMGMVELYEENGESGPGKPRRSKAVKHTMQSRAFVVTDRLGQLRMDGYMDVERFVFQPGKLFAQFLFGLGRQTALLSAKAVEYDPYRQKWEKRLARYLSWQWRIQVTHGNYTRPYRVATLLEATASEPNRQRPALTRERLEKTLDTLQKDGVIAHWQYEPGRWDETTAEKRGWLDNWLQATILLEPPDIIRRTYKDIERYEVEKPGLGTTRRKKHGSGSGAKRLGTAQTGAVSLSLGEIIENRRRDLGLSQMQTAEHLGIAQSYLSKLERNQVRPAPGLHRRIQKWLNADPGGLIM